MIDDIEALFGSNVCTDKEKEKCKDEIGDPDLYEWACSKCEKKKSRSPNPWTIHILWLRRFMKAGYPFDKSDLSYDEWMHLGLANELIESKKM